MPVYVDDARIPYRGMLMHHMLADTTEELLAMAEFLGLQRRWLQYPGTPKEHFDVCLRVRAEAVRLGAIEVRGRDLVGLIRRKRTEADGGLTGQQADVYGKSEASAGGGGCLSPQRKEHRPPHLHPPRSERHPSRESHLLNQRLRPAVRKRSLPTLLAAAARLAAVR